MSQIIVSYFNEDSGASLGKVRNALLAQFGSSNVAFGVQTLYGFGEDWEEAVQSKVNATKVMLVIMSHKWATFKEWQTADNEDFVAITTALKNGKPVVPVVLDGANLPAATNLHDALEPILGLTPFFVNPNNVPASMNELATKLKDFGVEAVASTNSLPAAPAAGLPTNPYAQSQQPPMGAVPPQQPPYGQQPQYGQPYGQQPPMGMQPYGQQPQYRQPMPQQGMYPPPYPVQQKSGGSNILGIIIVLALVFGGGYFLLNALGDDDSSSSSTLGGDSGNRPRATARPVATNTPYPSWKSLETVTVYANGNRACMRNNTLSYRDYRIEAVGRIQYDYDNCGSSALYANAEFQEEDCNDGLAQHSMFQINNSPYVYDDYDGTGATYVSSSDKVTYYFNGTGSPFCFHVSDGGYSDNSGSFSVYISEWR